MNTWTRTLIVGAALLAGCEGSIGTGKPSSGSGASSGSGTAGSTGDGQHVGCGTAGSTTTGTAGTTVFRRRSIRRCARRACPPTSQLPRLTRAEYDKTTRDLLGLDMQPSTMLAPDTLGSVDQRAWDGFKTAADSLATQVIASTTARGQGAPVHDATARPASSSSSRRSGRRRSGVRSRRRRSTRFQDLYTNRATLTQAGTFDQAVQADHQVVPDVAVVHQPARRPRRRRRGREQSRSTAGRWRRASRTRCGERCRTTCCSRRRRRTQLTTPGATSSRRRSGCCRTRRRAPRWPSFHEVYALQGEGTRWSRRHARPGAVPGVQDHDGAVADRRRRSASSITSPSI